MKLDEIKGEKVIRDPSPRIVKKDQYEEEHGKRVSYPTEEADISPLNQMDKIMKLNEGSLGDEQLLDKLGNGR